MGLSKLGALLPALSDRWSKTAEPASAGDLARLDARRESHHRNVLFADFIGDRLRYASCTFDNWQASSDKEHAQRQNVVVARCREYCESMIANRQRGMGVLLYGPPGTGKDHLATAIVRAACLNHGQVAMYANGVDWFGRLRDAISNDTAEKAMIGEMVRPDWLLLSDPVPPVGNLTPYQSSMLYRVVNERIDRLKPTIVTVNVQDGAEGVLRMGGALWDRLKGESWVFACNWPSYRKPAKVI